ncbi:uncharacterized protein [Manis javanica]
MTGTQVWQPTNLMIPAPSHRLQVGSVSGMGAECGGEELRGEGKEGREEELVVGRGRESEGQELSWEVFGHISVIQGCHPLWEGPCVPPAPRVPLTQLPDTKETRTVGKGLQPACPCSRNPQPPLRLSWPLLGPWASAILCGRPVAGSLAQDHGKPLLWDSSLRHPVSRLLRTTHTIWSVLTQTLLEKPCSPKSSLLRSSEAAPRQAGPWPQLRLSEGPSAGGGQERALAPRALAWPWAAFLPPPPWPGSQDGAAVSRGWFGPWGCPLKPIPLSLSALPTPFLSGCNELRLREVTDHLLCARPRPPAPLPSCPSPPPL